MANNEAGAFLNITPDVLKRLESFDDKLEKIQEHAHTAADALKNGFGKVTIDTTKLENAITSLVNKIAAINATGDAIQNIGASARGAVTPVQGIATGLTETAQIVNRLSVSRPYQDWNIAGLKAEIDALNLSLRGGTINTGSGERALTQMEQQAIVDRRNALQEEMKIQEASTSAKLSSLKKLANAQNADLLLQQKITQESEKESEKRIKQAQREYNERAKLAKQSNYAKNTTAQGALSFSDTANTLQRQITAIEYLKKARLSLNTTDANYKSTIGQINQAISKHNQALQEAGVKSQQLAIRHRNLMDTAGQLKRQLSLLFSVSQIEGYISKLANVRGEFELQQRSLQAILQNKSQADQIFNKTVQLAVKSPFQIKELVTYTKQLAAYRVESNKLYDTTKRLADVSAGLGVDMGRLILAYGQVKAAAYLRGTEVRQFTEAGINLYGELQRYFEEVKGEAYTTAQIVDMISKRKVTFEDIENIFQRLTDKGGLFYNMQEIQAETLRGKISNLKDSIDVMLNSIGKANEDTLKGSIDAVKVLIDNWETVVNVAKVFGAVIGAIGLTVWSKKIGVANANVAMLGVGIKKLTATLTALKTTFMTSLPTAGIFLAIEALTELIRVNSEYKKSISESTTNYFKNRVIVSEIDKESESDIKSALAKLVKAMNNEGFEIEIKANISEDEARKEFDNYKQMYENFLYDILVLEQKYAENKKKGWMLGDDDIDTDAEEYKSSLADFISRGEKVRAVLLQVSEQSTILTEKQKEQFKQLAAGADKGENIINYYERLAKALEEVGYKADEAYGGKISKQNILGGEHQTQGIWGIGKELDRQMAGFSTSFITMNKDLEEFKKEAISIIGEVRKDMTDEEKNNLKIKINYAAIEHGWDDVLKDIVYQTYYIDLKVDSDKVEKEMDGLDAIFKKWFSSHKYKLGIDYKDLGKKDGFKGFLEQGDEMAAAYKKAELSAKRLKNAANTVFNQKQSGLTKEQFENAFGTMVESVSKEQLLKYYEELAKANKQAAIDAGWSSDEKDKSKRDIWAERISVLKEMQSRYEKLNELMGETRAIEETRSAFKGALDFTQMGEVIKPEDIIPTKQGMIDALEKLLKQIPNDAKNAAKRTGLEKEIAELKIGIQQDYLKEQLEKTKNNIEDMFTGLDLHKKLKDAGLSEAEVQQLFPGLAKTLDDVQKGMEESYKKNLPKGEYLTPGTDANKKYIADLGKMNQQRVKESQDLVVELTKAYKTQLSDQFQLDNWYYKERSKIYAKAYDEQTKTFKDVLTPEMQQQYEANLNKMYEKRTSENAWKEFTSSDGYLNLFDNIEYYSTTALQSIKEKLASLRTELKELSPENLKQIMEQERKLDEQLNSRNPWKNISKSFKEYIALRKSVKANEKDEIEARKLKVDYDNQLKTQGKILAEKKASLDVATDNIDAAQAEYDNEKKIYGNLVEKKEKQDEIVKGYDDANKLLSEQSQKLQGIINSLGKINLGGGMSESISGLVNSVSDFSHMLEDSFGVEIGDDFYEILDGVGALFGSLESFDITKPITSSINVLTGLGKTIGSIFGFGNKDKKLQKEIEKHQNNIEKLDRDYNKLKKAIDSVWDITQLQKYGNELDKNIKNQIVSLQAMIAAERDKKKVDQAKIKEWKEQIEDLQETLKENEDNIIAELGGVGSDENFKTLADNFASAWLEAFNETGDGLSGLQSSFDEFMENYVKQQILLRLSNKYLEPFFKEFDEIVAQKTETTIRETRRDAATRSTTTNRSSGSRRESGSGSGGRRGSGTTSDTGSLLPKDIDTEAIKDWSERLKIAFGYYNEAAEEIFDQIGWNPGGKAELSALTQSIQGVTETTAEALEALLGSIRFFVATQTSDITAIRNILETEYMQSEGGNSNPMLIELKSQTEYLKLMSDNFESILSYSGNSKGRGIRVFMQ